MIRESLIVNLADLWGGKDWVGLTFINNEGQDLVLSPCIGRITQCQSQLHYHDIFEIFHLYIGWTGLTLMWSTVFWAILGEELLCIFTTWSNSLNQLVGSRCCHTSNPPVWGRVCQTSNPWVRYGSGTCANPTDLSLQSKKRPKFRTSDFNTLM